MPLQEKAMWHFTVAPRAIRAVNEGLELKVTDKDPITAAGVWLSPNVFGSGSPGSVFGPIGLRVRLGALESRRAVPVAEFTKGRQRFVLLGDEALPSGATEIEPQPTPTKTREYFVPAALAANEIEEVFFAHYSSADFASRSHQQFLAHLVATKHALLRGVPHPGELAVGGGLWTMQLMQSAIVKAAAESGQLDLPAIEEVLAAFSKGDDEKLDALIGKKDKRAVWGALSDCYGTAYESVGKPLPKTGDACGYDRPFDS